jgi:drug/metabolite transporter (DMT)-like permease
MRAGIAALFLVLAVPSARRGWNRRTVPVAAAFGATLLLFVLANKLTTAANTIFLQSTSPLYLLLLSPWLLKERIRGRDVVMLASIAVGMALFFWGIEPPQVTAPAPARGNSLAAAAGLAWALTVIGLRWLSRGDAERSGGSMPAVVLGNALIVFVCLPRILGLSGMTLQDLLVVGFLGVVQVGLAYVLLTRAMRRVPAIEASLLLMAEPVLSPVWAWFLHGETVGPWRLAGGALILAATALPALYEASRRSGAGVP